MRQRVKFERISTSLSINDRILGFTLTEQEEEAVINVAGVIGSEWDGLDAATMVQNIQQIDMPITLRLNTPGGMFFEAVDIYDALVEHPHPVRADIVSEAWSCGTILAAAADKVRIRPWAKYGLHRAWSGILMMGNEEEIRSQLAEADAIIGTLQKLDVQIAQMIAERSGNSLKEVHDWMVGPAGCDGTEFVGQEAVDAGFADELIETTAVKNQKELFVDGDSDAPEPTEESVPMGWMDQRLMRANAMKRMVEARRLRRLAIDSKASAPI